MKWTACISVKKNGSDIRLEKFRVIKLPLEEGEWTVFFEWKGTLAAPVIERRCFQTASLRAVVLIPQPEPLARA